MSGALSDQLKEQTKANHQALEKQVIPLIKAIRTTTDYSKVLMLFYTFYGGVELLIDHTLNIDVLPDYLHRRKTASLTNDLYLVNAPAQAFAGENDLPAIINHLQATGAMYVMEGSTLGGLHISRMISQQLNELNANAFTFFNGYQNETKQMWQAFKMAIDGMSLNPAEEAVVVATANETFTRFSKWISLQ
jgi:heme oxygenase